jgi:hypothetical protein
MPVTRMRELAPIVQEAGIRISRELGYQGSVDPDVDWKICGQSARPHTSQKVALGETIQ